VPFVDGEHVERLVPARQHDERRVGKTDVEIGVGLDDLVRDGEVACVERFEPVGAARDLGQQRARRVPADAGREQVVELGEDERRQQQRPDALHV
jgi:hypothetical protein